MRNTNFLVSRSSQTSLTLEVSPYLIPGRLLVCILPRAGLMMIYFPGPFLALMYSRSTGSVCAKLGLIVHCEAA